MSEKIFSKLTCSPLSVVKISVTTLTANDLERLMEIFNVLEVTRLNSATIKTTVGACCFEWNRKILKMVSLQINGTELIKFLTDARLKCIEDIHIYGTEADPSTEIVCQKLSVIKSLYTDRNFIYNLEDKLLSNSLDYVRVRGNKILEADYERILKKFPNAWVEPDFWTDEEFDPLESSDEEDFL